MFTITFKLDDETRELLRRIIRIQRENMNALQNLNANITALTLAVQAIIPDVNPTPGSGATEAQVQAAADAVAAQTAILTAATTPPVVAPAAPTLLTAVAVGGGVVNLTFAPAATPSVTPTGYAVNRGAATGA